MVQKPSCTLTQVSIGSTYLGKRVGSCYFSNLELCEPCDEPSQAGALNELDVGCETPHHFDVKCRILLQNWHQMGIL